MSCLFNSIGGCLGKSGSDVRREICEFMNMHQDMDINDMPLKQWIEISENRSATEYITAMQSAAVWGGGLELTAASNLYNISIIVNFGNVLIRVNEDKPKVIRLFYTGSHYYI